jgi:hypothetical protein
VGGWAVRQVDQHQAIFTSLNPSRKKNRC